MSQTVIRGTQILNNTVQRQDLDTSTVGQAVVTKLVQGSGITLSSTGADSGTGDVTVSGAPASSPVILGETAADAFFTGGIIVPSYKNHPDAIWTYGTFDDHFDGTSLQAKWTYAPGSSALVNIVNAVGGSRYSFGGSSPVGNDAIAYSLTALQPIPNSNAFTITWAWKVLTALRNTTGSAAIAAIQLFNNAGTAGPEYDFTAAWNTGNSTGSLQLSSYGNGGTDGTYSLDYLSRIPSYVRLVYLGNPTYEVDIYYSEDGINWIYGSGMPQSFTGFSASVLPQIFKFKPTCINLGRVLLQIDWIKFTNP